MHWLAIQVKRLFLLIDSAFFALFLYLVFFISAPLVIISSLSLLSCQFINRTNCDVNGSFAFLNICYISNYCPMFRFLLRKGVIVRVGAIRLVYLQNAYKTGV